MIQIIKYGVMSLAGLALTLLLSAQSARAEMEVLESSVPGINAGTTLKDDARLKLPDGTTVRLLTGGAGTKTLKGPYEGTVADYKDDLSWWERLIGRTKDPETPMGATRGLKVHNP